MNLYTYTKLNNYMLFKSVMLFNHVAYKELFNNRSAILIMVMFNEELETVLQFCLQFTTKTYIFNYLETPAETGFIYVLAISEL